jgi:hypothetical protein
MIPALMGQEGGVIHLARLIGILLQRTETTEV